MKISILGSRGVPACYGGFETFAEHLSVGLAKNNIDVTVYCPHYQSYKEAEYNGVKLEFIKNSENLYKNRVARAICNLFYDVRSLIEACRSDVTHIYMLGYASGPFLILPRFFKKIIIVNPDGLEWKSTRWGIFARSWLFLSELLCAKVVNCLIGDAEPITERFRQKYNANISTIEYGTELYVDNGLNLEYPSHTYYLAVARMVPETKIDVIIEGFKSARIPNRKLIIVGPIADQKYFREKVEPKINNSDVIYLGAIYDKIRLKKLRANAFSLIHGHASDGTNPSLLESMGCSSPVIAIDRESNAKVLERKNAIYFVDSESLAHSILKFENLSFDQKEDMRLSNFNRVSMVFSWDKTVQEHLKIFKRLMVDTTSTT